MKRRNILWISLVLCLAIMNLSLVGPTIAGTKPAIDPISGLSSDSRTPTLLPRSILTAASNLWTKYSGNPVLDVGLTGNWDSSVVGMPSVLVRNGNYYLWYSGFSGSFSNGRIGLATSPDGVNWTKNLNNPVLTVGAPGAWDSGYVFAPQVIYHDGMYKMWFRGTSDPANSVGASIGYATSPDGVNWVKYAGNPVLTPGSTGTWDDYILWSAYVMNEGSIYKMWYSGGDGSNYQIGYATSSDGINWTKYAGNPVLDIGVSGSWDSKFVYFPNILFTGNIYEMWYSAYNGSTFGIGYATSTDGVNWNKNSTNPILTPGPSGSWDSAVTIASSVIAQVGIYKMWYTGTDTQGFYGIGYATSSSLTERVYLPIILR